MSNWVHMLAADLKAGFFVTFHVLQSDQQVDQNNRDDDADSKDIRPVHYVLSPLLKASMEITSEFANPLTFVDPQ